MSFCSSSPCLGHIALEIYRSPDAVVEMVRWISLARRSLIFPLNDQMTPTILVLIYRDAVWANQERHWNDVGTSLQPVVPLLLWLSSPYNFLEHRHMRYWCISFSMPSEPWLLFRACGTSRKADFCNLIGWLLYFLNIQSHVNDLRVTIEWHYNDFRHHQ